MRIDIFRAATLSSGNWQFRWRAFILVGSRADSESCVVGSEAGIPPFEVLAKPIVDDADAHLQHQVRTLRRPAHRHALVDDLVDGGLHERGRDAFTSSISPAIVG